MNRKAVVNIRRAADHSQVLLDEALVQSKEFAQEVSDLYSDLEGKFRVGTLVKGKVLSKSGDGVLVSIDYKSDGLISNQEFSEFELERIKPEGEIEVLLDRLEDENGMVILSYQKAKSLKAWDRLFELAEKEEPVKGIVTHKVKGGLSVDVGIPAFLPGSQVDIQRVNNFDSFVGQEVTCSILKINRRRGNVIVSRRKFLESLRAGEKVKALETLFEGQIIEGVVKNITNYGVFVDVGGIDGLLHITDMSWGRVGHPSELVKIGDTVSVKVISFDKEHEKISLGMKQLQGNPWDGIALNYPIGKRLKGSISSITDYGLFVEIDKGIEGLVHISEISWTERIHNLSKYYNVGDKIDVIVVAIDEGNRRMSLSIKRLAEDPWKLVFDKFKVGDRITGAVNNVTDFGIFVQLQEGVDGLVHISDISWTEHISHPADKYKKADVVNVVVLAIDKDNKRISLGIKQLDRDPWERIEEDYPVGKIVEGVVSKITGFGAFIKFDSGIEGLVHISEFSNKEVSNPEEFLKVGDRREFKVVKSNQADRKLGLSLRAVAEPDETKRAVVRPQSPDQSRSAYRSPERPVREKTEGPVRPVRPAVTAPVTESAPNAVQGSLRDALKAHMKEDAAEAKAESTKSDE